MTKLEIAAKARKYIQEDALILDTETTAAPWINPDAEVCEVAIINASGTLEFSSLIKTVHPIDEATSKIHGITNEMCANAPTWQDIYPILGGCFSRWPVLAYNAKFDSGVLAKTAEIGDGNPLIVTSATWGCLMQAYQEFYGYTKWQKLTDACKAIGYTYEGAAHRAMADAKAARAVLLHMANYRPVEQIALIEVPAPLGVGYLEGE